MVHRLARARPPGAGARPAPRASAASPGHSRTRKPATGGEDSGLRKTSVHDRPPQEPSVIKQWFVLLV